MIEFNSMTLKPVLLRLKPIAQRFLICVATALVISLLFASCTDDKSKVRDELRAGFKDPPIKARPKVYWWWLNGYVDSVRLKQELRAIKDAGLGGVDIFEIGLPPERNEGNMIPGGPAFMSNESLRLIQIAVDEAGALGLEVGLGVASSWNAGGSWVKPEHAAKTLYASAVTVDGGAVSVRLPFPEISPDRNGKPRVVEYRPDGKPVYSKEVAVVALPRGSKNLADTSQIFNISEYFNPDTEMLTWDAPAGAWDIYRYVCSNSGEQLIRPSPNSQGPIIDHFDSSATRMHMMYFIDRLRPLLGDFEETALTNLYLASYEAKDFAWTPTFPSAFKKLNGYDVYKFLPAIFDPELFNSGTASAFQSDFTKTFSELMINNHYRKSKEICNENGLKIISEAGGPGHMHHIPVETLKALGSLDIPRGEFWYNREYFKEDSVVDYIWLVKEIAAASHIYKRGIVEEEAFTSYWDWQEGPANLKIIADRAFCEGMNKVVIHGFPHNPSEYGFPGIAYFAGTHFNDKRVWWPKVKPFNDYLGRISYILQESDFVSDVLLYYGDKVPNLVPPKNTRFKVGDGFDYEIINTEILLNDLTVEDGQLVLPGVGRYKVLSIGNEDAINVDALAKLEQLASRGAIIVGSKAVRSSGLNHQPGSTEGVRQAADLWTTEKSIQQKGKIFASLSPAQALEQLNVLPDIHYEGQSEGALDFIHYSNGDIDFYLLRNTTGQWVTKKVAFRQQNKTAELWDPVTGEIIPVPVAEADKVHSKIVLSLAPYASYFVAFSGDASSSSGPIAPDEDRKISYTEAGHYFPEDNERQMILDGSWTLTFPPRWGAPDSVNLPKLISWAESDDAGVRYFSGIATYYKQFQFNADFDKEGDRVFLEMTDVAEVGEVWLNDRRLGITWTKPHRFDITDVIRNGTNELKIEVANTWSNRLTGDAITGSKFTETNILKANKYVTEWSDVPLKKSGITGEVTITISTLMQ
jgi:hypothetical protein